MLAKWVVLAQQLPTAPVYKLLAPTEFALMQRLAEYPGTLTLATQELAPHHLAFWLRDCAADFHAWYNAERVLVDDTELRPARLRLASATGQVIANRLDLLWVSSPARIYRPFNIGRTSIWERRCTY